MTGKIIFIRLLSSIGKAFWFFSILLNSGFSFGQESEIVERYVGLDSLLNEKSFFGNHHTGFVLFDLDSQRVLYEKNSHLNFIPASTTKLLTFYATIIVLKDSLPVFRYVENNGEITLWGTGFPSWKYKDLPQPKILEFLGKYKSIKFSDANWKDEAFGYGWQWDDYYYSYSSEKSPFPVYGNFVTYSNQKRTPISNIPYFNKVSINRSKETKHVERSFHNNDFYFNPNTYTASRSELPFITSPEVFVKLAEVQINIPVGLSKDILPESHKVLRGGTLRPIWTEMLQESDNFLAEQLLLMVSDDRFLELNTERAIDFIQKTYLRDLPDKPQWVDGSGLSRHNLITPRSMITLLVKLEKALPRTQIMQLLPQGGVNGTLKNNYKAKSPYIFAKTGTISNNLSLIGYIKTDSGHVHAFAFMNNNYLNKSAEIRREMEKVMVYIKEKF
ncbi:D-alanyl-D-alanine carboxypeptidase [Aquiflexum sp.]|uniref:D-alanyl-D-alanine carboxypeptidase n=1 Tax=Aquiflexum sp. TaxID=1872584 RepID=UPI003593E63F